MKIKTSITLSEDILQAIDRIIGKSENRSAFIEAALKAHIAQNLKKDRDSRDLRIINENSEHLNQEAEDVLSYQVEM